VTTRNRYLIVGAAAMLAPAVLALIVFPTAMIDTREVYAWGRFFPLATHKHPPMMALIGGVIELVVTPNAFWAVFVCQRLNAVGVFYLYATLRMIVAREPAMLFAFLYATSSYFLTAPLSYALNADILQVPIWLAVVYHFVKAAKTNHIGHWLALAAWVAAAVLTKYSAGILFVAGFIASLIVPGFQRVWRNPRFYLAIVVALVLLSPHLIALSGDNRAIGWAITRSTTRDADLATRLVGILPFIGGALLFMAPGWIIIAVGFLNGNCTLRSRPDADEQIQSIRRFLIAVALLVLATNFALAIGVGTLLKHRYGAPMFGLFWLAAAAVIDVNPSTLPVVGKRVAAIIAAYTAAVFVATAVIYGVFTSHGYMQEPIDQAAMIVRDAWGQKYSCGPGYFFGDRPTAHGFAVAGDRHAIGIPTEDIPVASWFDPDLLAREGAIVISWKPISASDVAKSLPGVSLEDEQTFSLPLLRTFSGATITYYYSFIPPTSCATAPSPAAESTLPAVQDADPPG
jgi:4-amino-4-deoxy-L-arabinose transferase-like glycosyltransferase